MDDPSAAADCVVTRGRTNRGVKRQKWHGAPDADIHSGDMKCLHITIALAALGLGACGEAPQIHSDPNVERYTLEAKIGDGEGVFLESGTVVGGTGAQQADIYLHLGMSMVLMGPDGNFSFCSQGDGYDDIHSIPNDATDCTPSQVFLSANFPHDNASRAKNGDGYVFHDSAGRLHSLLVVAHSISSVDTGGIGRATFEVLPLE
jgi:hypothetical protein